MGRPQHLLAEEKLTGVVDNGRFAGDHNTLRPAFANPDPQTWTATNQSGIENPYSSIDENGVPEISVPPEP